MEAPRHLRSSRAERLAAILIAVGTIQFIVAMGVVQVAYPGYSLLNNYISDLGNTTASPWHVVANVSVMVLGILAFIGLLLLWGAFPAGPTRPIGLGLLLVASVSAILVGLYPENVNPAAHDTFSLLVFLPGGVALATLSFGMRTDSAWAKLRWPSLALGLINLAALAYYVPTQANNSTVFPGLVERLIVFPILIWALAVAALVLLLPRQPHLAVS